MVLNAAELVSMESILFLSAMFQACQFQFSPKYNHTTRTHTQPHTHTQTQMYQGLYYTQHCLKPGNVIINNVHTYMIIYFV